MAQVQTEKEVLKELRASVKEHFGAMPILRWFCWINGGHRWAMSQNGKVSWTDADHWEAQCCTICRKAKITKKARSWKNE